MLLDKDIANRLTKSQLIEELSSKDKAVTKLKKPVLAALFLEKIYGNDLLKWKIIKKYSKVFALHPLKIEELLGISKTERTRWTKESKLPVVFYVPFKKWGQELVYPMYNYYEAMKIQNKNLVDTWRNQHKNKVINNRKASVKAAVRVRKENHSLAKLFYENEWKTMLKQWYMEDPITGSSLQLAFWTMWVNRFAKEMQMKERKAVKKTAEYRAKKELFYQLKGEGIQALMKSPLSKMQFYRPAEADKIFNLQFCELHYEYWLLEREHDYVSKWDFFWMNERSIKKCPGCTFVIQKDYFSLFYLSVSSVDIKFSFHIPYPLGKDIFPDQQNLEKVFHHEQEGIFRLGRGLLADEKIIFTEKNIIKYFNEAFQNFNTVLSKASNRAIQPAHIFDADACVQI